MTGRNITTAAETASQADTVRVCNLVHMEFDSGDLYLNSSPYKFTFGGNEYLGIGTMGGIGEVVESNEVRPHELDFTLTGLPASYIATALTEKYKGRSVTLYLGLLNEDHTLIADPVIIFKGRMDVMTIVQGSEVAITVTAESRLVDWSRVRTRRFTHQDQQELYPTDLGLEFVANIQDAEILWGRG